MTCATRRRHGPILRAAPALALLVPLLAGATLLSGCTGNLKAPHESDRGFHIQSLMKTDVDLIAEYHQHRTLGLLRELMEKLYRRNPREWRKGGSTSMDDAVARVFESKDWRLPELRGAHGIEAMRLAFDEDYDSDRVLALIAGLCGMVIESYNGKTEFFMFDDLDAQRLYNAARNVEIAAWKLRTARDADGDLLLLSTSLDRDDPNLSFERLIGKIIAHQDSMADIMAAKSDRRIKQVIQGVASAVFIPI